MPTIQENPVNNNPDSATTEKVIEWGAGRYSALAFESFKDAKRLFKLTPEAAERLARQIASDFGAAMRKESDSPKTAISKKRSKDGQVTLKEASKVKTAETFALMAMRTMAWMNEAVAYGVIPNETEWVFVKKLQEYFDKLQAKCDAAAAGEEQAGEEQES
jgi:hypothetical protein